MEKILIIFLIVSVSISAFFFSNIKGYFRFRQYCESEGGIRIYEPFKKGVGWWARDKYAALETISLHGVGFVRYIDSENKKVDLFVEEPRNSLNPKYHTKDAEESTVVLYKLDIEHSNSIVYEPESVIYKVVRVSDEKVMTEFKQFHYAFFNSDRTPLNTNQKYSCYAGFDKKSLLQDWVRNINSAFQLN